MMLFIGIFLSVILAAIPNLIWMISWVIARIFGSSLNYASFGWTALTLVSLLWLLLAYGYFIGRFRVDTRYLVYHHKDIPSAFDGFRIVHISDMHLSTFDDKPEHVSKIVEKINALNPDIVCFTGDLVTIGRSEAEPYADALRKISAKHGVVSVLGNHDFLIYARDLAADKAAQMLEVDKLVDFERGKLGWNLLRDSSMVIRAADGSTLTFIGVDNKTGAGQGFRTTDQGDLSKAMEGAEGFKVLLSHDPSHWEAEVIPGSDIQLTLSGHTHAAQIGIFGWNAASMMFRQSAGLYTIGEQSIYVNAGLGCTAPVRIGSDAEISVIDLSNE